MIRRGVGAGSRLSVPLIVCDVIKGRCDKVKLMEMKLGCLWLVQTFAW